MLPVPLDGAQTDHVDRVKKADATNKDFHAVDYLGDSVCIVNGSIRHCPPHKSPYGIPDGDFCIQKLVFIFFVLHIVLLIY